jgi:hypothetical protein
MSSEQNRAAFPVTAWLVDEMRKQGFEPKVIWCCENGSERGKRPEWAKEPQWNTSTCLPR